MKSFFSKVISISLVLLLKVYEKIVAGSTQKKQDKADLEASYYKYEAQKLGLNYSLVLDNVIQISDSNTILNVWQSGTDLDGKGSLHIAGNKKYCYKVFQHNGIPVPRHKVLKSGDVKGVFDFKREIANPVVIKPAKDTGDASGVFINLESFWSIFQAANYIRIFGPEMIVEEFITGKNYRLLFCYGDFIGACERMPSSVKGDGIHSVQQLISIENETRLPIGDIKEFTPDSRPLLYKIQITSELKETLKEQNMTLSSVPEKDRIAGLQPICHWLYGGQYIDVTEDVHHEYIQVAKQAVDSLGIKLAGVDLIAKDIINFNGSGYAINEVNTTPAILVHYEVQNQKSRKNVCRTIIEQYFGLFKEI